ncbi:MAG: electron transfer flavoprotein subunit alpha/FixB family protein [Chloroflexi bacterium]|nr:electron transfer flavoprotein subunit alpha/FixB family protein [Chloroflexota bacterium]
MILVVAEQREGKLNRATWETIAAAQALAGGMPIKVVVIGGTTGDVPTDLASADVAEILVAEHESLEPYTPDGFAMALQGIVEQAAPAFVVLPHTYQTRDFAPSLAARMRKSLVTDVTGVTGVGASATFSRPMFQGKLSATVKLQGTAPHFVSFQIGAYRADAVQKSAAPAAVTKVTVAMDAAKIRQTPEAPFQEAQQAVDLSQAERIVAIGRGIKAQEHLAIIDTLAKAFGAEVAASRPICDSGWLPMDRQIGSSGQTVAPKLYVALGISGAIQHVVGMKGSRTIVAINKDAEAPIFEVADYGIVGDLFEIVPALVAELEKA